MFTSTRKRMQLNATKCIVKGISDEGGLFILDNFNGFDLSNNLVDCSYQELAFKIFKFFFKDFTDCELEKIVNNAYNKNNFNKDIVKVSEFGNLSFLELYHGPTMAFKDMALTILPHFMAESKRKLDFKKKTLILTATSGDTGGACLSGFQNVEDTKIVVLYPTKGVSKFQEAQMHYYSGKNAFAIAVDGNFDDCQNLVKKVFTSNMELKNLELSSANSINIGRLVPQVVYYFYSYLELVKKGNIKYGEKINFVVPTGNFGNILACYIAKQMGLFINKIVCASNENKVLTDFFNTLEYDKNREFYLTNSPAMDILISSNLERLLYLITDCNIEAVNKMMNDLKEKGKYTLPIEYKEKMNDFLAYYVTNDDTIKYIEKCFKDNNYLIDPHTAVAYGCYLNLKDKLEGKTIVVSTASPYKFMESVEKIFDLDGEGIEKVKELSKLCNIEIPNVLFDIYNKKVDKTVWTKENMEENLRKFIGELDESC